MRGGRVGLLLVTFVALLGCASAPPKYTLNYVEKRAVLANGMRLVVVPDRNTPMVLVAVRYEVGSRDDPPGKAGLAHFAEHMMFLHRLLGPDKPTTFELLPQIATSFNAYTNFDKTHYWVESRREDLDALLQLEAARMAKGCESIDEAEFEREREVVRNENRARLGTEGYTVGLALKEAYPEGHPYRNLVGGDDQQLSNITLDDVCKFLAEHYVPERATVIVVGNVSPENVGRRVASYFGPVPRKGASQRREVPQIDEYRYSVTRKEADIERNTVWVMWKLPPQDDASVAAMSRALLASLQSRVARFNADWKFATGINSAFLGGSKAPVLALGLELRSDVDTALGYVWKAADSLHRSYEEGAIDTDTRNLFKANFISGLESLYARADVIADLVTQRDDVDYGSNREYLIAEIERFDKLDGGEFRDFTRGRLNKGNARVLHFVASERGLKGDPRSGLTFSTQSHEGGDRRPVVDPAEAKRPLPVPDTSSILSGAERYQLKNGMRVVLLPYESMPVVTVRLVFDVGAAHEPKELAGIAALAAGRLNPPADADFWYRTGLSFGGLGGRDQSTFFARGMSIYTDVAIKGLERIIKIGNYDQRGLELWQRQSRSRLERADSRRLARFSREFRGALYGADHPYTRAGEVTVESIGKLGYDALNRFRREHYSAGNGTLYVVGSFDAKRARAVIEETFGDWDAGRRDRAMAPTGSKAPTKTRFGVVDPERRAQLRVQIGYPSPGGIDGKHAARLVLAAMLREVVSALRTELGATYGVSAIRRSTRGPTAYAIAADVDTARAGEAVAALRERIDDLRRGANFDPVFATARRVVLKRLLSESTESFALAGRLASIAAHGKAPDYHEQLVRQVASVSPALVRALLADELAPGNEVLGMIGTREALDSVFAALGEPPPAYIEVK